MMRKLIWISLFIVLLLAACAKEAEEVDPADSVEAYLNAMVKNEVDKIPSLVCADYERDARRDFDTFSTSTSTTLEGVTCKTSGEDGSDKLVSCEGKITSVYRGEPRDLDLTRFVYRLREDDGEWKVCGYE